MNEPKTCDASAAPFPAGDVADSTWNRRVRNGVGVRCGDNGSLFSQHLQLKMWNFYNGQAKYSRCKSIIKVRTVTVN